ncbi:sulfonate ABC transporter substrate-binding protein [Lonepinella koalarum]|uniref:Putative aliphatic sulfonates-binding protein n=1 Tax=Lonepinella koalarum TaxID=53417 RepID=A0A4R1KYF9_9PAST|nr:sulfonate ABC transporter substrate-binding protein [Lonepinella koalarum]MDH2926453.1 ABC transporter substrate-binding protein [Lonepinella koalarum]TCK69610.1 sulfonate transport system substrate-binding protein [Lonepinella koalarum]TFJ89852.1 sulfonate ABC transporter substrate-binding protein [Lonepinella koalarum]TYG34126.1 sulfonate ABC transporter substrate-binding protein [Lonepinella koalarum]
MKKLPFLHRGLTALVAAVISLVTFSTAYADTLRIGYQKYGPLVLLKDNGTLEKRLSEQGVEVKWTEFPGGPQLLEGLNVGSVDFGMTGETPPVFAQAAKADLVYVAYDVPAPTSEAILVPKDSPIQSVADLKGKKVALNKGSNVHYLLVRALESVGLTYADVQPVYLAPSDARAAFERGSVDAWVIWDPFQAAAEEQLQARTLRDGTNLVDNHQFYLSTRNYANNNPEIIKILIEEVDKTGNWIKSNLDEATDLVAPIFGLSREIAYKAVARQGNEAHFITDNVVNAQQKIADTFTDLKLIPVKLNISEVIWTPPAN